MFLYRCISGVFLQGVTKTDIVSDADKGMSWCPLLLGVLPGGHGRHGIGYG